MSETKGIEKLAEIRGEFAAEIRDKYEPNAKPCSACPSPGICCRDVHFVNVHITRLEAATIIRRIGELNEEARERVFTRVTEIVAKYDLTSDGDTFLKTFACPLFEKGVGCLVHETAKPLPCIAHACYEKQDDLPPEGLLFEREKFVASLNRRVYGSEPTLLPLPVALTRKLLAAGPQPSADHSHRDQQNKKDRMIPDGQQIPRHYLDY